jgi:hypothetical protein
MVSLMMRINVQMYLVWLVIRVVLFLIEIKTVLMTKKINVLMYPVWPVIRVVLFPILMVMA